MKEKMIITGNNTLDNIIADRSCYCTEHGINYTCVADGGQLCFMTAAEIYALIDNALKIVINYAAEHEDAEKRLVKMAVFKKHKFLILRFENYMEERLISKVMPVLSKENKNKNCSELRKIKAVISKYEGCFESHIENNWFYLCVLIPLNEKQMIN